MVASEFETATRTVKNRNASRCAESGGFVLWQMDPDMWYVELAVGGSKVHAGCNGKLVWRHTPWLGAHTAKGPVRPLRRALQVNVSLPGSYSFKCSKFASRLSHKSKIALNSLIEALGLCFVAGS